MDPVQEAWNSRKAKRVADDSVPEGAKRSIISFVATPQNPGQESQRDQTSYFVSNMSQSVSTMAQQVTTMEAQLQSETTAAQNAMYAEMAGSAASDHDRTNMTQRFNTVVEALNRTYNLETEKNMQAVLHIEAREQVRHREMHREGEQIATELYRVKAQLTNSEHGSQQLHYESEQAKIIIISLTEQRQIDQALYAQRDNQMICELQAQAAAIPQMSQSDQQWSHRLKRAEEYAAQLRHYPLYTSDAPDALTHSVLI